MSAFVIGAVILANRVSPRYASEANHCQRCTFRADCDGGDRSRRQAAHK